MDPQKNRDRAIKIRAVRDIKIDREFEARLKALDPVDRRMLHESVKANGIETPLEMWGDILVDGHNRLQICKDLGISKVPTVQRIEIVDRDTALNWIISNQIGRRNLGNEERNILLGILMNLRKKIQGSYQSGEQNRQDGGFGSTAETISEEFGVPVRTIERAARHERAKERARKLGFSDIVEKLDSKVIRTNMDDFATMSARDEFPEVLASVRETGAFPKLERKPPMKATEPEGMWAEPTLPAADPVEVLELISGGSYTKQIERLAQLSKLFFVIDADSIINTPAKFQGETLRLIRALHDHAEELLDAAGDRVQVAQTVSKDDNIIDGDYTRRD